jgi:hypothetical protein
MSTRRRHAWISLLLGGLVMLTGCALLAFAWRADQRWFQRHLLLFCFVVTPAAKWAAHYGRVVALSLGLLFAILLAPLAARWASRRTTTEALAAAGRVALAIVASLGVCELGLRRLELRHQTEPRALAKAPPHVDFRTSLCQPDPRYGWVYRPSQTQVASIGGREVPFSVNSHRNRARTPTSEADPDRPTILFAGESVMAGQGLLYEESFPARVASQLGVQEVNLAVPGYGNDQAYLRLADALPEYSHPVAVVTLFLPPMLSRNFQAWRPHLELDRSGRPELVQPYAVEGHKWRLVRLISDDFPYWSDEFATRTMALSGLLFRETAKLARAHGATPLFVIPMYGAQRPLEAHPEAWAIRELFESQQLPYVLIDIDDSLSIAGDGHPNAEAAALIASRVSAALRAAQVGPDQNHETRP